MANKISTDEAQRSKEPSREHLFWAREFTQLARKEAAKKGVPDHAMAQAMLVQAWMLFTGQNEQAAIKSVSGLFSASMAKAMQAGSISSGKRRTASHGKPD